MTKEKSKLVLEAKERVSQCLEQTTIEGCGCLECLEVVAAAAAPQLGLTEVSLYWLIHASHITFTTMYSTW